MYVWTCVCVCARVCDQKHKTEAGLLDIIEHLPIRILREPHHRPHGALAEKCSI